MARRGRKRQLRLTGKRRHGEKNDFLVTCDPYEELWRINWKAEGFPFCGVYVVTTDSLYPCKIGISQNPVRRLASMQTSHWRLLQITEYRWCENEQDAKAVEKLVHEHFREQGKCLNGEWFDVRPDEALEAVEWVALAQGIAVNKHIPAEIEEDFLRACQEQHERKFFKED